MKDILQSALMSHHVSYYGPIPATTTTSNEVVIQVVASERAYLPHDFINKALSYKRDNFRLR